MARPLFIAALFILGIIGLLLVMSGCSATVPVVPPRYIAPPESAPVVSGQIVKDATITDWAAKIDAAVDKWLALQPSELGEFIKTATAAQRAAIASAPAADIAKLVQGYEAALKSYKEGDEANAKIIAKLTAQVADLKDAELKKQAASLRWFGLAALAVAGLLAWARQLQFAAVAALTGLVALGLAQLISQPWFMPAVGIATALVLVVIGVIAWKKYQADTLAKDVASEAARMQSALLTIVPAVDGALASIDDAAKATVKAALSRALDADHKALIHEVRAKLAAA